MTKSRTEIAKDLLKTANYYWHEDIHDPSEPVDIDRFDPIIDKLFKAVAVEIEKLYDELEESHQSILVRLAGVLVPDESLLPKPGYTIVQLDSGASRIHTIPEDQFTISGMTKTGEEVNFYFSPLFEHDFPNCLLKTIITENSVLSNENGIVQIVDSLSKGTTSNTIWFGLSHDGIVQGDWINLYLDPREERNSSFYINLLRKGTWTCNSLYCNKKTGLEGFTKEELEKSLLDRMGINSTYLQRVRNRFDRLFLHLQIPKFPGPNSFDLTQDDLINHGVPSKFIEDTLLWLKVSFDFPMPDSYFIENPPLVNCIPLINRRLIRNFVTSQGNDSVLLPFRTNDEFLDIHHVYDSKNSSDGSQYTLLNFHQPDDKPGSFIIRSGNRMRRLNREDATDQIHRLLETVIEEYRTFKEEGVNRLREDFDLIEKAIRRIKIQLPEYFRNQDLKDTFYGIAKLNTGTTRLYYSYWETQGSQIQVFRDRIDLQVVSAESNMGGRTISPIYDGMDKSSPEHYLHKIQRALGSKEKILTKGDIELFCQQAYNPPISIVRIENDLIKKKDGQLSRGIIVRVRLGRELTSDISEIIRIDLENELNSRSAFFTEIRVVIANDNH